MTCVDFYILSESVPQSRDQLVCKLASKAWWEKHKVYIYTESQLQADTLDDLLWTYKDISFVPHEQVADINDPETPILIACNEPPAKVDGILINMAPSAPHFCERFERILEIIDHDKARRLEGRRRYRLYQERGYTLRMHDMGSNYG
jgi:DNA polymerase-3 subunit chi